MTQTIVVIGKATGEYSNKELKKEFSGTYMTLVRPEGAIIVQNLDQGVRPICYIGEGAEVSLARDMIDANIELIASTEDGQRLIIKFHDVRSLCGIPEETGE